MTVYTIQPYRHKLRVNVTSTPFPADRDVLATTHRTPGGRVVVNISPYAGRNTVVHEAAHAAIFILGHRGVLMDADGANEAFTYLIAHVADLIWAEMAQARRMR